MNQSWHHCRSRDDLILLEIAALERKRDWLDDQISKLRFVQALIAQDPDGWELVPDPTL